MRSKTIQKHSDAIKQKTGIDFAQYRDDEWAATLAELIRFPLYAGKVLARPLILLLLLVVGISIWTYADGHPAFALFFFVSGLVLTIPNGLQLGVIWFIYTLTGDLSKLLMLTTAKVRNILGQLSDRKQLKAGSASLIQGVVFSMLLPDVNRVIKKSIPVAGGLVAWVVGSLLAGLTRHVQKKIADIPEKEQTEAQSYLALDRVDQASHSLARRTARWVSAPIVLLWLIVAGVSALIIWLEYRALY